MSWYREDVLCWSITGLASARHDSDTPGNCVASKGVDSRLATKVGLLCRVSAVHRTCTECEISRDFSH